MDKEYILLSEIDKNENITQRELSKKAELSLGSVNLLINKMVHEGLVKIKQIPMNRVAYMLTPSGIAEKVRKTSEYIKIHYNYINETSAKIKNILLETLGQGYKICILLENDEITDLLKMASNHFANDKNIMAIENADIMLRENVLYKECLKTITKESMFDNDIVFIALSIEVYEFIKQQNKKVINLLELI